MRIGAIVQARLGSTRLPGKVLEPIAGKPMLAHVIERAKAIKGVDCVIVTIPYSGDPVRGGTRDPIYRLSHDFGALVDSGSETDVLGRYYKAAVSHHLDVIVRITGDCPLLDPVVSSKVLFMYMLENAKYGPEVDYVSNRKTYPDGLDTEVFSFDALSRAHLEATSPYDREHVTSYMYSSGTFLCEEYEGPEDLSHHKWSVDTPQDLEFVRGVYNQLEGDLFGLEEVLALLAWR